jgi:hypothetical protein
MNSQWPGTSFSSFRPLLLHCALLATVAALTPASFAQQIQPDTIPVRNWPLFKSSDQKVAVSNTSGLVFIAIKPCRVMDTRAHGGSGNTGQFGPPSLVAAQARVIPVPSSNCGVPVAAAYSMNFVSVTPPGEAVAWVAAWQDDAAWPGTVVLNAVQGGMVANSAIVSAGADGGIQVLSTNSGDLVIDMNGYYVQATTMQGAMGPQGPIGNTGATGAIGLRGPAGNTGAAGTTGAQGPIGNTGAAGAAGAQGSVGNTGPAGAAGAQGPIGNTGAGGAAGAQGPIGNTGAAGAAGAQGTIGNTGPAGAAGAQGPIGNTGATGAAGGAGAQGPTGDTGAAGAAGTGGILAFGDFFALMPPDNAATVAPGTDVSFPQDGPISSGSTITRTGPSTFNLSATGTYQVMFQVSVSEAGQLILTLNGADLAYTVVGRATGTSQIVGMALVTTTITNSILTVRNPAGNSTALTITPLAGGTRPVSAHLVIMQIELLLNPS